MRHVATVLVALGALGVAPALARAAPRDFTSGSASFVCLQDCGGHVSWTAHGTPANAKGNVRINAPGLTIVTRGSVDCVSVAGNRAAVSGVLDEAGPGLEGPFYELDVEDNGPPRRSDPDPDRISLGTSRFPVDCRLGTAFSPVFPVSRGNVVVKDNTP